MATDNNGKKPWFKPDYLQKHCPVLFTPAGKGITEQRAPTLLYEISLKEWDNTPGRTYIACLNGTPYVKRYDKYIYDTNGLATLCELSLGKKFHLCIHELRPIDIIEHCAIRFWWHIPKDTYKRVKMIYFLN